MSFQAYKRQKKTSTEKFDALRILSDVATAQLDQKCLSPLTQSGYEEISDEIIGSLASSENTSKTETVQDFTDYAEKMTPDGHKVVLENNVVLKVDLEFSDQEILDLLRLPKIDAIMDYIKSNLPEFCLIRLLPEASPYHWSARSIIMGFCDSGTEKDENLKLRLQQTINWLKDNSIPRLSHLPAVAVATPFHEAQQTQEAKTLGCESPIAFR